MIRQRQITIVVIEHGDRHATRRFLAELAKITDPGDNVLLAHPPTPEVETGERQAATRDAPKRDETRWRVRARDGSFRRVDAKIRKHAPKPHAVVVIVDERIIGAGRWIDRLVEIVETESPAAVAPRTNWSSFGELCVGVPYRSYELAERSSTLRRLDGSQARAPVAVDELGGPCIATTLDLLGGHEMLATIVASLDLPEICRRLRSTGKTMLVAEDVFLHHPGGTPLSVDRREAGGTCISACLIVKNESENLDRCLQSISDVVDEIVVYDTGSSDNTIEIARRYTNTVIEGYWDDNFARARNDALAHCNGEWILWLDADEALICDDPNALRHRLRSMSTEVEACTVLIDNLRGTEASTSLTHPACRIFRRAVGHWKGALHEQITARAGNPVMAIVNASELESFVRIRHWGYLQSALTGRSKGERNLKTAFGDLAAEGDLAIADRVLSLGRSYQLAGKRESGIELCRLAATLATYPPTLRMALRGVIEGLTAAARYDEALKYVEPLRLADAAQLAHYLEGLIHLAAGAPEKALDALDAVADGLDVDGFEYSHAFTAGARASALSALKRHREAANVLLDCVATTGSVDAHLGLLLESMVESEMSLELAYDAIGEERVLAFAPQLLQIVPEVADQCCESWYARSPHNKIILAVASQVATGLGVDRQRIWSERVRASGLSSACPLIAAAATAAIPTEDRIGSATAAAAAFDDPRGHLLVDALTRRGATFPAGVVRDEGVGVPMDASVLIVGRDVASPEAIATSIALNRVQQQVTLLHPLPADSSHALLGPLGISVHGWIEPPDRDWKRACLALVALIYADRPIDTVVLLSECETLAQPIRDLLPLARVCNANDVLPALSPLSCYVVDDPSPVHHRRGIAVACNLQSAADVEIERFTSKVAPLLTSVLGNDPIILIGDDPHAHLASSLPLAIPIGAIADATPWISSTRVLLIPCTHDAPQWLAMASACRTPAFVVPENDDIIEPLVRALSGLSSSDVIWNSQAPSLVPPPIEASSEVRLGRAPRVRKAIENAREVRFIGALRSHTSLARVNRELAYRLSGDETFTVTIEDRSGNDAADAARRRVEQMNLRDATRSTNAGLEIRHSWPPDFSPPAGRLAMILPWEFGAYPAEWVGPIRDVVDEVWVPSTFVRDGAIAAGVDADRVFVVPNGVDTAIYRPDGPKRRLATKRRTRFLFVGGLIDRKGIDVLLEVYLSNFTASDDVCLVVKPFGSGTVYHRGFVEDTLRRAANSHGPEIEIIDEDLDDEALAALYRSCTALVHPYRGEGFGLPIAEAMSCGLPVVITDGGAAIDFCDEATGWLVDAVRSPVGLGTLTPYANGSWWLEPSRVGLERAMRTIVDDPDEADARGARGAARIASQFTWDHAATVARERIVDLLNRPIHVDNVDEPEAGDHSSIPANAQEREQETRAAHETASAEARSTAQQPNPTATIISMIGPTSVNARVLEWAMLEVAADQSVDLVVADDLPPFSTSKPTMLAGERIKVLRNYPSQGSTRALQNAVGLAEGEIIVLVGPDVEAGQGLLDALRRPFMDDPAVGVVLPTSRQRADPSARGLPPLVALRSRALAEVGGRQILTQTPPLPGETRGHLLGQETLARFDARGWTTVTIASAIDVDDGLVEQWPEQPNAISGERPLWVPREISTEPTPGLNVIGLLEASCGIGDAGRRYVDSAAMTNHNLSTFAFHLHSSPELSFSHYGDGRVLFDTNLFVLNVTPYLLLLAHAGFAMTRGRYNILMPFWELEELSGDFEVFRLADEIWAASRFLEHAYSSKANKPVTYMPLPVPWRDGSPTITRAALGLPDGFTFLTTFDFVSLAFRKNSSGVIEAFKQAFSPGEGPTLVLKAFNSQGDPDGLRHLQQQIAGRRDIVIIDRYVDDETLSNMVGSSDCYVSLHRSEGFGLTLADAMAWGRPVIATNYSGNCDFMTEDNSYLVAFDWGQVPDFLSAIYPVGARWAEPRIADAAAAMRAVYFDQAEASQRAAKGRSDIRRTHGPKTTSSLMADRLNAIAIERAHHPRSIRQPTHSRMTSS